MRRVSTALATIVAIGGGDGTPDDSLIAGISEPARYQRAEAAYIARSPHRSGNVLLIGETGTGKDTLVAEIRRLDPTGVYLDVHGSSFVPGHAVNQGAGHVVGSFTDARRSAEGFFAAVSGGSLVLADADDLPDDLQGQLVRLCDRKELYAFGSTKGVLLDVRLITLLHEHPLELAARERMRLDLAYRLSNGIEVRLAPLRERREDIPVLIPVLLKRLTEELKYELRGYERSVVEVLAGRTWPGNIRQLESALRKAVRVAQREPDSEAVLRRAQVEAALAQMDRSPIAVHQPAESLVPRSAWENSGGGRRSQAPARRYRRYASCKGLTAEAIWRLVQRHGSVAEAARAENHCPGSLWRRMRVLGISARRPSSRACEPE